MVFTHKSRKIKIDLPKGTGNVGKTIRKGRFYEKKFLEYIAKQNIDGVYVDVGANIGNHSVYFGIFSRAQKIISFEPHPIVFEVLKKNIENNKLNSKVDIYNVALGEKSGKCSIAVEPTDEIGGARVVPGNNVDQWKLDRFVEEKIAVIKMDVEGYEKFVVKGAKQVLKKHKPELFVELTSKKQYLEVYNLIKEFGYQPIGVFNNSATYHFSANRKSGALYRWSRFYPLRRIFLYS